MGDWEEGVDEEVRTIFKEKAFLTIHNKDAAVTAVTVTTTLTLYSLRASSSIALLGDSFDFLLTYHIVGSR